MSSSSAILVAKDLSKVYRKTQAQPIEVLKNINFEVNPGDRIAIVGKSGTGKSTLLHLMGTLEAPSSGKVLFLGQDVFAFSESRLANFRNHQLGFVFQFHYLMLEFNALENVMMPALLSQMPKKEASDRAKDLLDKVGLSDRLTHKPSQLSGGEQQRVAIARALMMKPKLLLTDEMTGNLDPATGNRVFDLLQTIHSDLKMALVSVTHDEQMAHSYDQVYQLTEGTLKREK